MERECQDLDRAWERVPRLGVSAVLAIPAGFLWGIWIALVVFGMAIALVLTAAYLTGVRRTWAADELKTIRADLARLERAQKPPAGAVPST